MKLLMLIIIAIGVTAIYDARKITKKYFSTQDQNRTTSLIKITGFFVSSIAGIMILCV